MLSVGQCVRLWLLGFLDWSMREREKFGHIGKSCGRKALSLAVYFDIKFLSFLVKSSRKTQILVYHNLFKYSNFAAFSSLYLYYYCCLIIEDHWIFVFDLLKLSLDISLLTFFINLYFLYFLCWYHILFTLFCTHNKYKQEIKWCLQSLSYWFWSS